MASEYSVNIKLNTSQVKKDLKTIGKEIENVGRKSTGSKKRILTTDADDQLLRDLGIKTRKFARTINPILNKADKVAAKGGMLALPDSKMLNAQLKGIKRLETSADTAAKHAERKARAEERSAKFSTEAMKANQASAKAGVAHARKLQRMTGDTGFTAAQFGPQLPMQGPRMFGQAFDPTGGSSALNFSRSGRLLQGPAGSSANTFGNLRRRFGPTRGFDFGSAAISGGFPLLFGQGPLGALAGGLGGGIGGMFGQMGGFAGGIAATAILQQVQNTIGAVSKLGQAFNTLTPDVEGLTTALGASGTEREKQIELIKKTEGTQAALAAVTEQLNQQIGEKGVKNLKEFGETSRLIGNAFQLLGTQMLAALAPILKLLATPITAEAARAETNRLANVGGAATDQTLLDLQSQLENVRGGRSGQKQAEKIRAQIEARKEELAILGKGIERQTTVNLIEDSRLKKLRQSNALLQAKIDGNHEEVLLAQEVDAKIKEMLEDGMTEQEIDRKKIEDLITQNNLLEKQAQQAEKIKQQFASLGQSLATDVADGLQGLIRGTSTLNDMLNNVLNKLIDAAFNMALFGNPSGTLGGGGLFGSIFGGLGSLFSPIPDPTFGTGIPSGANLPKGSFGISTIKREAGGPVKGGGQYLVGERGPEMFTPGVSGMITPNHALGGTTNIVVNVDASGSNVEGDEQEGRELGKAISVAVQSELIKQKRPGGLLA